MDQPNLLSIKNVCSITTLSRASIYRYCQNGQFPAPVKIGPCRIAWRSEDLLAWQEGLATRQ
ncbi:MAG: AlpA family phage regulatory protein [Propionivibrio sp.]|nr:AlpA family phage regulatory protein [Propionivibrio sp.]